jgi:hypothetical protein
MTNLQSFSFADDELALIGQLRGAIRSGISAHELAPKELYQLAILLHAIEKLPEVTPGLEAEVYKAEVSPRGMVVKTFRLTDQLFELSTSEVIGQGLRKEVYADVDFSLGLGVRGETPSDYAEEWIRDFASVPSQAVVKVTCSLPLSWE